MASYHGKEGAEGGETPMLIGGVTHELNVGGRPQLGPDLSSTQSSSFPALRRQRRYRAEKNPQSYIFKVVALQP